MIRYLLVFATLIAMNSAAADVDGKTLILSCQEYVAIYDRRGEKSLLASISTSPAEAMRAGICRGMLEEHAKHQPSSCDTPWYQQALFIANQDAELYQQSREQLLDEACGG